MLRAKLWIRVPARIEQHENGFHAVRRSETQKAVQTVFQALRVFLPELILQEYPDSIHAGHFCKRKLLINQSWIECCRLEHLKLIDCVGRDVIDTDQPRLLCVPFNSLSLRPPRAGCEIRSAKLQEKEQKSSGELNQTHERLPLVTSRCVLQHQSFPARHTPVPGWARLPVSCLMPMM